MATYQPIPQRSYYKFLSPSIIVLLLLTVLPILFTLYLSTSSLSFASPRPERFIGLRNYSRLLDDARFLQSIPVSALFIVAPVRFADGTRFCCRHHHE